MWVRKLMQKTEVGNSEKGVGRAKSEDKILFRCFPFDESFLSDICFASFC